MNIKKKMKIAENITYQVIVFVILMGLLFCAYFYIKVQLQRIFDIIPDDFSWVYQIDKIEEISGEVQISGWAFDVNANAESGNCEVVLYDIENDKRLFPKMEYMSREDVNEYFLCEYDYTESGFKATISLGRLQNENGIYEIILRPSRTEKAYATGIYYANGKMFFTNPQFFVEPEVIGTDLEEIVEYGILRVYQPEYGRYVYQYEGELYWIADEAFEPIEEGTWMQLQMTTTQIQNLPEERLKNDWYWDNQSFIFEDNEVRELNTEKYRVATCKLPENYSIVKIWTGDYIKDWKWISYFRPWYSLKK